MEVIYWIISTVASSGIVLFIFKTWIKSSIQHEYDKKLEKTKNEMTQQLTVYKSFADAQNGSLDRRLNTIENAWSNLITFRNECIKYIGLLDIFTAEELLDGEHKKKFPDISNLQDINDLDRSFDVDTLRPFLGEKLWYDCTLYKLINLRVIYAAYQADTNKIWYEDKAVETYCKLALSTPDHSDFEKMNHHNKSNFLFKTLEKNIADEMNDFISGKSLVKPSSEQMQAINKSPKNQDKI